MSNPENNTSNFLKACRIRKKMSTVSGCSEQGETHFNPRKWLNRPSEHAPEEGDILQFSFDRCVAAVVLKKLETGEYYICPLSDYDDPATNDEVRVDGRVFQLWNIGTIPGGIARHGKLLKKLNPDVRKAVWNDYIRTFLSEVADVVEQLKPIQDRGSAYCNDRILGEYLRGEHFKLWSPVAVLEDELELSGS